MLSELLYELCQLAGPSGFENRVAGRLGELLGKYVDETRIDKMGNFIALKKGTKGTRSLMLAAHMDQVSLVVESVDQYVRFRKVGFIDSRVLIGTPVLILSKERDVPGVVCSPPGQVRTEETRSWVDLWIDVGDRASLVRVGDPIVYGTWPLWLNEERTTLASPSVDDRVGCAVLAEVASRLAERPFQRDIYFVGTVQEEIGAFGMKYVLRTVCPDWLVAVDNHFAHTSGVVRAGDTAPKSGPVMMRFACSRPGEEQLYPGVAYFSSETTNEVLSTAARRLNLDLDISIHTPSFTDTVIAYGEHPEVHSSHLGIPRRYAHSPYEVVNTEDADKCVAILVEAIANLDGWEE